MSAFFSTTFSDLINHLSILLSVFLPSFSALLLSEQTVLFSELRFNNERLF